MSDKSDFWAPFAIRWEPSGVVIDWCHMGARRFVDPFFDQTIRRRQSDPDYRERFRVTSVDAVEACPPGLKPTGFIFHSSRCGSTLISQMLASMPQCRVLSEPSIVGTVLQSGKDRQEELLRGIVGALGIPSQPSERHYFIKFDSRAMLAMPFIRRTFPGVPWLFVYRDPLEILGAQSIQPDGILPPGIVHAKLLEGDPEELQGMPPEEFWARVLATRFKAALEWFEPGRSLLVHYQELPGAVWQRLAPFFGIPTFDRDIEVMRACARQDAKNPTRTFASDSDRKKGAVSPALSAWVDSLVTPLYRQLEEIRLAQ